MAAKRKAVIRDTEILAILSDRSSESDQLGESEILEQVETAADIDSTSVNMNDSNWDERNLEDQDNPSQPQHIYAEIPGSLRKNFIKKGCGAHKLYMAGLEEEKRIEAEWKKQEQEDKEKIKKTKVSSDLENRESACSGKSLGKRITERASGKCSAENHGEQEKIKCSVESRSEQEEVEKMLMYSCGKREKEMGLLEKRDNLYKSSGCDVEQPKLCKGCFRKLGCLKTIYMCFGVLLPLSPKIEHMVSLSEESLKFWQPLVDATFANPILTNRAQPILTFGALISIVNSTQTHSHIKAFSSPTSPFTSPDIKWTSKLDKQLTPALLEIPHNLATSSALTSLNSPSLLVHVMMLLYWLLINSSNKNCHNVMLVSITTETKHNFEQ
uniref:Uncharacterized protein n=1 Tax=Timema monikensis TaxID=170555 RepID=A0A7R9HQZ2_9NEOP|nr:unnamed protein product [Timema monikensis]